MAYQKLLPDHIVKLAREIVVEANALDDANCIREFVGNYYGLDRVASISIDCESEYDDEGGSNLVVRYFDCFDKDGKTVSFDFTLPAWKEAAPDKSPSELEEEFDRDTNEFLEEYDIEYSHLPTTHAEYFLADLPTALKEYNLYVEMTAEG